MEESFREGTMNKKEVEKYKYSNFANVIYRVEGGKFANEIKEISDGYY